MMNAVALCMILGTFLAAEVWTPTPAMIHRKERDGDDVIFREGHRVVVVEYDPEGTTNTKISISPRETTRHGDKAVSGNVKETVKEAASHLPNIGQGISWPETGVEDEGGEEGETRERHARPSELICDAFGKCRHKIASALGKAKDRISRVPDETHELGGTAGEKAREAASEAKEKVARMAHGVKETMDQKAQDTKEKVAEKAQDAAHKLKETMADKTQDTKEKIAEKAQDAAHKLKETMADKTQDTREKAAEKAQDLAHKAKETVADKIHEAKDTATHKAQEIQDKFKEKNEKSAEAQMARTAWKRVKNATKELLSPAKVGSVVGLMGVAMAYGTCVWVTFVSSYALAGVLGRHQFGLVQSKVYPLYFKAVSLGILIGLLGHVVGRRRRVLTDTSDMLQGLNLLGSLLMVEGNASFLEPRATKAMFERLKAEKEEGRGRDSDEPRPEEEVAARTRVRKLGERLQRLNTYSSWINVITLMSLTWHLVYLGLRLSVSC